MRLMDLQGKKPENGRITVLRDKQATSKVVLIFLNFKILKQMTQRRF